MSAHTPTPTPNTASALQAVLQAELLDDDNNAAALTLEALASACHMDAHWVAARLQEGLLHAATPAADNPVTWRFTGATVVRARRLAHLEITFDADPHLAALTTDLIEEVSALRRQLQKFQSR